MSRVPQGDKKVQERKCHLRREAVIQAYQDLRGSEREDIYVLAEELDIGMKSKSPYVRFSHNMAVELLGSIGILVCHIDEARQAICHAQE